MTSHEIRKSFLEFFASKQHRIVPSAPVIPHGDPTLLFTNAGMNQFKDIFLGISKREFTRAADTQKCIRVSGKHNDLEEVGRDTYHHTFFEMLGNWSFGDYYKKEAIEWAWDLLTTVWKIPKERLWATVYNTDEEAFHIWEQNTDIDPSHILRFAEKDNFWEMGETGPCGPCSEIHIDLTPRGDASPAMVNAGTPDLIEIWNLVFIQNNRNENGVLEELPAKHVDTGMGFERVCAVMESMRTNFKKSPSNYEGDVFLPLISRISEISKKEYKSSHSETDVAIRVIADHIRALTFAIADGATPSNEGRGYVLRRILRRAARFGRTLDVREPFIFRLTEVLVETMSDVFPEIKQRQHHIERIIKSEEEAFNQTLDRGLEIFESVVANLKQSKVFPGEDAFKLYDTFGFPLDLTELLCKERQLTVDAATFVNLMGQQRDRSREAGKTGVYGAGIKFTHSDESIAQTDFVGYTDKETESKIIEVTDQYIVLDRTPFYAESGGQVGDTGNFVLDQKTIPILDTQRDGNVIGHRVDHQLAGIIGKPVIAKIDTDRRSSIMRNHSATHLLHAALRKVLGTHVHQSGSLVAPDHFRFDFAHFAKVSSEELTEIENLVNEKILDNLLLHHHRNIPFEDAQKMGALMFFGDKYGDFVNVVQFGDFTNEFCGGTHVPNTGEIGYLKIRSEESVASGVRRIDGLTGTFALNYLAIQNKSFRERIEYAYQLLDETLSLQQRLEDVKSVSSLGSIDIELRKLENLPDLPAKVVTDTLSVQFSIYREKSRQLEEIILSIGEKKKALEKESAKQKIKSASTGIDTLIESSPMQDGMRIVASKIDASDMDSLKSIGDSLREKLGSGVGLLASVIDGKVALVCVVTDDLIKSKKLQAGVIVGAVAKILGGGGGGKPHLATAGGRDVAKIDEALANVAELVKKQLRITN